ncbi:MAG: glycosyltransferase [Candidatus Anstonellales archaeon]
MTELAILLPTYNEEENIEVVLSETLKTFETVDCEILIVDGNSTDKTKEIANRFAKIYNNVKIIEYPERGKAKAIAHVIQMLDSNYVIMYDVDQSYSIYDAFKVYQ